MSRFWVPGILSLYSLAAFAQVAGSITGTVADSSGRAIAGASVTLTNEGTGAVRFVNSDTEGNFVFTAVQPSVYAVGAGFPGFKKYHKEHIELAPGDHLAIGNLPLQVGEITESVTVRAEGATLQTESSERAGIVTSEEIQ